MEIEVALDDKTPELFENTQVADKEMLKKQMITDSMTCKLDLVEILQGLHAYNKARSSKLHS